MNILDNALVLKYFGWEYPCGHANGPTGMRIYCDACLSLNVLLAMQEPIQKGERILEWCQVGVQETIASYDMEEYHPINLRLPTRFQAQEKKDVEVWEKWDTCGICKQAVSHTCHPPPSENCEPCKDKTCEWPERPCSNPCRHSSKSSRAVEAKISELANGMACGECFRDAEAELRELVKLARELK